MVSPGPKKRSEKAVKFYTTCLRLLQQWGGMGEFGVGLSAAVANNLAHIQLTFFADKESASNLFQVVQQSTVALMRAPLGLNDTAMENVRLNIMMAASLNKLAAATA